MYFSCEEAALEVQKEMCPLSVENLNFASHLLNVIHPSSERNRPGDGHYK